MMSVFLKYDSINHPIKNIKLFFRHIKWSWQRVHRGYSDYDIGDIDFWFNAVVPDMLLDFRNHMDGYPMRLQHEFHEEHKEEIGMPYEDLLVSISRSDPLGKEWDERMNEECRKRWRNIIDEMRFMFLEANEDTCTKYPRSKMDHDEYLQKDDEINEYRADCRKKAFALFCEWFEYLWN